MPSNWIIDWRRFFDLGRPDLLNVTRNTDTKLVPQLHNLPEPIPAGQPPSLKSLAVRNLLWGRRVGLPTGQDVAGAMGVTTLTPAEIASGDDGETLRQHGFHETTPLWYYVLKEAEVQGGGKQLGEVGSRIVAEVFVGLLEGDPYSFLSKRPDWTPTPPSTTPRQLYDGRSPHVRWRHQPGRSWRWGLTNAPSRLNLRKVGMAGSFGSAIPIRPSALE